jgi:uncharacterized protein YjbJ (UPF0337 family)
MNKDRIEGMTHQAKGSVKQGIGDFTNNPNLQAKGIAEKAVGKMQNNVGKLKDAAHGQLKKSA